MYKMNTTTFISSIMYHFIRHFTLEILEIIILINTNKKGTILTLTMMHFKILERTRNGNHITFRFKRKIYKKMNLL